VVGDERPLGVQHWVNHSKRNAPTNETGSTAELGESSSGEALTLCREARASLCLHSAVPHDLYRRRQVTRRRSRLSASG
jgi:hypothetical protein